MLTLSFQLLCFCPCEWNEAVEKIQKLFSFGGWREEQGRGGAIFDQTEKNRIFFSSRSRREKSEKIFSLLPSNFWTLIKKEERVKMAASVSWSQRWLRPEVSDSRSSSFFETTTDDTC